MFKGTNRGLHETPNGKDLRLRERWGPAMVFRWSYHGHGKAVGNWIYLVKTWIWDTWEHDMNAAGQTAFGLQEDQEIDCPREVASSVATAPLSGGNAYSDRNLTVMA